MGWGWARGWELSQPGQLTSADQRVILCHIMLCSAVKLGGGWRLAGHLFAFGGWWVVAFALLGFFSLLNCHHLTFNLLMLSCVLLGAGGVNKRLVSA